MLDGLAEVVALSGPNTKNRTGHGHRRRQGGRGCARDMILAIRDKSRQWSRQGMTLEQGWDCAAKPTAAYDAKVPGVGTTGDRFVGQLYAELKAAP